MNGTTHKYCKYESEPRVNMYVATSMTMAVAFIKSYRKYDNTDYSSYNVYIWQYNCKDNNLLYRDQNVIRRFFVIDFKILTTNN